MKVYLISLFIVLILKITLSQVHFTCDSQQICEKCSETDLSINGEVYCLKCNEQNGYIGIAGICTKKELIPVKRLINNCQSYSPTIEFCAVCKGSNKIHLTKLCDTSSKLDRKWKIIVLVSGGCLLIGLIVMIILLVKYRKRKSTKKVNNNPNNEIIKYINTTTNKKEVPPLQQHLQKGNLQNEDEFYFCEKYFCFKSGCNEQAVMKSNCKCGYLCVKHANLFYNNNNLNSDKRKTNLKINNQKCNECLSFLNEIQKITLCEKCGQFDFTDNIDNKEICIECKVKSCINNL